ncbi:hypothetical protein [Marinobacter sp.]|uniref:hypothetical protein n=1 Tax=Marinobacter sp. TaxID=50741 RepID=UPI003A92F5EB
MILSDGDIQEELQHDLLYVSGSLADIREALEAHRRVTNLMEAAVNRFEGMRG